MEIIPSRDAIMSNSPDEKVNFREAFGFPNSFSELRVSGNGRGLVEKLFYMFIIVENIFTTFKYICDC